MTRQDYRFQLLAPPQTSSHDSFRRFKVNEELHEHYLNSMQRLRGRAYLDDGAIRPCELTEDGRFEMFGDEQSWHLLLVDEKKDVIGCARYLVHPNTVSFDRLRISHCALARDPETRDVVREAVESELAAARKDGLSYVEIGGWALTEEWRNTRAALEILVGSFALAHLWGGSLGACTATARHGSSSMLRRLGGSSVFANGTTLPSYNDPQYECQMELLRFDSRKPAARFVPLIQQLQNKLSDAVAVTPGPARHWMRLPQELGQFARLRMVPVY